MTPEWFLKGVIIFSIFHFMGKYGEANETKQSDDVKNFGPSNLTNSAPGKNAYKITNEGIRNILRQAKNKGYNINSNDYGTRKFLYKKYMKIGKSNTMSMDFDDDHENLYSHEKHNGPNNFVLDDTNVKKDQVLPTLANITPNNLKTVEKLKSYSQVQAIWLPSTMKSKGVKEDNENFKKGNSYQEMSNSTHSTDSENISNTVSYQNGTSHSSFNEMVTKISNNAFNKDNNNDSSSNLMEKNEAKPPEQQILQEDYKKSNNLQYNVTSEIRNETDNLNVNDKHENYNRTNVMGYTSDGYSKNMPINAKLNESHSERQKRSLKDFIHQKRKNKNNTNDKKIKENTKDHEQKPTENRRVRSCELNMEDLRESFIPYEELSIYHPKKTMVDQFILSDTMF